MPETLPRPFGKYVLLNKIAMGGMAEIFRAKTVGAEGFEKDVVIKRILPHYSEEEAFRTMFIDEARMSAGLNHPNIVQIFDFDKEGETLYIAMEYVEGRDLKRVIEASRKSEIRLSVPQVVSIAIETCKGLHYAHTRKKRGTPLNIVHRDVSPHNVMISFEGEVKVMDFGIAKAAARSTKTKAGTVKGKCAYMSPEQARGKDLDGRSDMFSVGVMMWEMLANERLFTGDSDFETLSNVLKADAPAPSSKNPDVPPELDVIVLRCLNKDREDRQTDCRDLARDLEQWLFANIRNPEESALDESMQSIFADEIAAMREMHSTDSQTQFLEASAQVRAQRHGSQSGIQSATTISSSEIDVQPLSSAPTLALDANAAKAAIEAASKFHVDKTVAVDSSTLSATGIQRPQESLPKSPSNKALYAALLALIIGAGAFSYYWFALRTPKPAAPTTQASNNPTGTTSDLNGNSPSTLNGIDARLDDQATANTGATTSDDEVHNTTSGISDNNKEGNDPSTVTDTTDAGSSAEYDTKESENGGTPPIAAPDVSTNAITAADVTSPPNEKGADTLEPDPGADTRIPDSEQPDASKQVPNEAGSIEGAAERVPPASTVATVKLSAWPKTANIRARGQTGIGELILEAHVGDVIAVIVEHDEYRNIVREVTVDSPKQTVDIALKDAIVEPPAKQLAKLSFTVIPANAKLTINGQEQPSVSEGVYALTGYKVGEDIKLKISAEKHDTYTQTLRISAVEYAQTFTLQKKTSVVATGLGTVRFDAKPWAKVTAAGQSCVTPCTKRFRGPKTYTATFTYRGVKKRKRFRIRPGRKTTVVHKFK
jgi:serine/threonine protein kinase